MKKKEVGEIVGAPSLSKADALLWNGVLGKLHKNKLGATNKGAVDFARPKDSPLHRFFEWDDVVGGEKFRLIQAAKYIREVRIVTLELEPIRQWVSIVTVKGRRYKPIAEVLAKKDEYQMLLAECLSALQSLERKYGQLKELQSVWAAARSATRRRKAA